MLVLAHLFVLDIYTFIMKLKRIAIKEITVNVEFETLCWLQSYIGISLTPARCQLLYLHKHVSIIYYFAWLWNDIAKTLYKIYNMYYSLNNNMTSTTLEKLTKLWKTPINQSNIHFQHLKIIEYFYTRSEYLLKTKSDVDILATGLKKPMYLPILFFCLTSLKLIIFFLIKLK